MRRQHAAFAILALLAVLFGTNLTSAATRFARTYDAYDRLDLNLTAFHYVAPDQPVQVMFRIENPSGEQLQLIEVELRMAIGVHGVGGGQVRPGVDLMPGEALEIPVELHINDTHYIIDRGNSALDWRVTGRVQVQISRETDPIWIPFAVRYLPQ